MPLNVIGKNAKSFTLIKGTFHVTGYSPDGDSVRFKADHDTNWKKISGTPKKNKKGHVQLRYEGIDALETHYQPKVKGSHSEHQPLVFADAARRFNLERLGIKNVVWNAKQTKVASAQDGTRGYIVTRAIDNPRNGRPVAFVYSGNPGQADGSKIHLGAALVRRSVNYKLVSAGYAYPTYYPTVFSDLRDAFTAAVKKARSTKKGFWPKDKTGGFLFNGKQTLTDRSPLLPKLFRRLIEHLAGGGTLAGFRAFLHGKEDGVLILPQAHHTSALDAVVSVKGRKIALTVLPENLVFDEKG